MNKPSIAFVGAGALAGALAVLLHERGYRITDVFSRTGVSARKLARKVGAKAGKFSGPISADVLWLAVPDAEIAHCAEALAETGVKVRVALHSSGALAADVLKPLSAGGAKLASAHPMMTFVAGKPPSMQGVWWALEGDREAVRVARQIANDLGSETFEIKSEQKALYHAFGAMLSPMLVSELTAAGALGVAAGVPKAKLQSVMRPIVERTLANLFANGGAAAFSGPLRRGDVQTIEQHLSALDKARNEREVYVALAKYAASNLPTKKRQAIIRLLNGKNVTTPSHVQGNTIVAFPRLLQGFVLDALANGYESFGCIFEQVSAWATEHELSVTRQEVLKGIESGIREGHVQCYLLSERPPHSQRVAFSRKRLNDLWFDLTSKGKQRVKGLEGG